MTENQSAVSVHCWEGRYDENGPATCMLPDQHEGDHEFTPDAEIIVSFAPGDQR